MKIHQNLNHPVHILDSFDNFTPSSFIPFCSFGGNMSVVGKKIDQFPVPVCNKFVKTTLNGQVCYSIDVNDLKEKNEFNKKAHYNGLNLFLDCNIERQIGNNYKFENDGNTIMDHFYMNTDNKKKPSCEEVIIYFSFLG